MFNHRSLFFHSYFPLACGISITATMSAMTKCDCCGIWKMLLEPSYVCIVWRVQLYVGNELELRFALVLSFFLNSLEIKTKLTLLYIYIYLHIQTIYRYSLFRNSSEFSVENNDTTRHNDTINDKRKKKWETSHGVEWVTDSSEAQVWKVSLTTLYWIRKQWWVIAYECITILSELRDSNIERLKVLHLDQNRLKLFERFIKFVYFKHSKV